MKCYVYIRNFTLDIAAVESEKEKLELFYDVAFKKICKVSVQNLKS